MMKLDMANFAVKSIKPHLMQLSVEYERNKFQEFLEKQPSKEWNLYKNHIMLYRMYSTIPGLW